MLLVVCAAPFAGLYVAGLLGVVIGVVVSAAAYVLTPSVWRMKVQTSPDSVDVSSLPSTR